MDNITYNLSGAINIHCPICKIDNIDNKHPYLVHKIKYSDFIEKYYPRVDLYTKELIKFKTNNNYFFTDFNNKINLKKYLESISKNDGLNYLKNWLLRRKQFKNLIYAPGEFECKSLLFPSIKFFHRFYGKNSYENICADIGLKIKFDYNGDIFFNKIDKVIVDTRESKPYLFDIPIEIKKLDFADYCSSPNPENIFFERKEIGDWAGVMSNGYERFQKELQRAENNNAYTIILIEAKYSDLLSINYLPQTKWLKASSGFLMKRARDLYLKFDNIQMVAGGTRKNCLYLMKKLLTINNIKQFDIQYLINMNLI